MPTAANVKKKLLNYCHNVKNLFKNKIFIQRDKYATKTLFFPCWQLWRSVHKRFFYFV